MKEWQRTVALVALLIIGAAVWYWLQQQYTLNFLQSL